MSSLRDQAQSLQRDALAAVEAADSLVRLEELRVQYLGKKGQVTELLKRMGGLSPEERKEAGPALNALKDAIDAAVSSRKDALEGEAVDARLRSERVDITLPAREEPRGSLHPITRVMEEARAIFGHMGFTLAEGPLVEDDFHNFTALNFPADHPAREMHDTFYLPKAEDGTPRLLRTHTSPVQVRAMLAHGAPLRVLAPGATFRSDSDMTHTPMFHQIEGLVVEEGIHMGHLKGCLEAFLHAFFGVKDLSVRFRPSFFPFTEPSAEVDIGCTRGRDELVIGGPDWLEILGCGMVHPNVLSACGLDPAKYQGFAFGMGVERLAMLKYGIADLRTFFDADARWLKTYRFSPLDAPSPWGEKA